MLPDSASGRGMVRANIAGPAIEAAAPVRRLAAGNALAGELSFCAALLGVSFLFGFEEAPLEV